MDQGDGSWTVASEVREVWASAAVAMLGLVLATAGAAKLRAAPSATDRWRRVQGAGELALAVGVLLAPLRIAAIALAAVFAGFAAVHSRHRGEQPDGCGCFGEPTGLAAHAGGRQLALTSLSAALSVAVAAVASAARAPAALVVDRPIAGAAALLVAAVAAQVWRATFTAAPSTRPASDRLVTSSALFLERRFSRRGMLVRLAAAGSALTVAPLRYLLYPGTALAAMTPGECSHGACTDGYTAFCCEINHGQNSCPTGTFPAGWWMCTDYPGHNLCAESGIRYYVDCNALPGQPYPGGCRCAGSTCDERRVACNVFRYGQCNTDVPGVTAVVCRMVVCENPSTISELGCSASMAVDDAVCRQDARCLEPAIQVGAPGGV
ncbi:MAG TPA: hypothetical protein VGL69_12625 [Solirubrobacteraceae bacterium]|jgi:hypothetical protein